jgi:hypothetical protein
MSFIVNNQDNFQTNLSVPSVNTWNKNHLHKQTAKLQCFQESACYAGIKVFNSLPCQFTSLMNAKAQFKVALGRYLQYTIHYSVDQFLMFKNDS